MPATIEEVKDEALSFIGEVAGPSVQTYTDDRMLDNIVRAFNLIWKRYPWEQYREWSEGTLDGTLGILDADAFEYVRDFEDIIAVHRAGETQPMAKLPKNLNPYTLSGTRSLLWTALPATSTYFANRKIQVWPKTAAGDLQILTRVYPILSTVEWGWDDTMHFDKDLLVYTSAFMLMSMDDLNPSGAALAQGLMDGRFKDIEKQLNAAPIPMNGGAPAVPNDWYYTR